MTKPEPAVLHLRLDQELLDRADALVPGLMAMTPGILVARPDVIRHALHRGLADITQDIQDHYSANKAFKS